MHVYYFFYYNHSFYGLKFYSVYTLFISSTILKFDLINEKSEYIINQFKFRIDFEFEFFSYIIM